MEIRITNNQIHLQSWISNHQMKVKKKITANKTEQIYQKNQIKQIMVKLEKILSLTNNKKEKIHLRNLKAQ